MTDKVNAARAESTIGHNGLDYQYYKKPEKGDVDMTDSKLNAEEEGQLLDRNKIGVFWRHDEAKINKNVL